MELTPTTELDAVNEMLSAIGETPVASLETEEIVDGEMASTILRSISRAVQNVGLHCNTNKGYRLSPNVDGEIVLPLNTLRVDEIVPQENPFRDLTVRGTPNKLYDRRNNTFDIGEAVKCDLVMFLDFEELPEAVRRYITIRSARVFHDRTLGDEALHQFTRTDEIEAKRAHTRSQILNRDANVLRNQHSYRIISRRLGSTLRREFGL